MSTETGASNKEYEDLKKIDKQREYVVYNADIRLGLALLAEHVYFIDGQKAYYDVPGFQMVGLEELENLIGKSHKTGSTYRGGKVDKKFRESTDVSKYYDEKVGDDNEYVFQIADGTKVFGNPKYTVKDFSATDEKLLYSLANNNKSGQYGLLSKEGFLTDCGFKAGIYKRTDWKYNCNDLKKETGFDLSSVKYALVFAGTDFNSFFNDWIKTNVGQGIGDELVYPLQYKLAVLLALKLFCENENVNKDEWVIVGHSLGGGLAGAAGAVSGVRTVAFNAAGLNTYALASYVNRLTKSNLLSQKLPKSVDEKLRVFNLRSFLGSTGKIKEVIDQQKNVVVYRSTTDVLTSIQDKKDSKNGWLHGIKWPVGASVLYLIVTPLSLLVTPIGTGVALCRSHSQGGLMPRTYGKVIDVETEFYKGDREKYLKVANDGTGHGMWMLLDGLVNKYYGINNHLVVTQQGEMPDDKVADNTLKRYWHYDTKSSGYIKLVFQKYANKVKPNDLGDTVYGFPVEVKELGKIVRQDDTIKLSPRQALEKEKTSSSSGNFGGETTLVYKTSSQKPGSHGEKKQETEREEMDDKSKKTIVEANVKTYDASTSDIVKKLFEVD